MKEMDPSEELLMERAMMEDEDLLIEVESMRQTLQKLDRLPKVDPPKEVTDSIMEKASKHAAETRKANRSFKPVYKYAVAATLALTITAGGTWFFMSSDIDSKQAQHPVATSIQNKPVNKAQNLKMTGTNGNSVGNASAKSSSDYKVEPWVDRNDIIRFGGHFMKSSSQFDAILKSSTKKLQLVNQPDINSHQVKSIQLTGTRQ